MDFSTCLPAPEHAFDAQTEMGFGGSKGFEFRVDSGDPEHQAPGEPLDCRHHAVEPLGIGRERHQVGAVSTPSTAASSNTSASSAAAAGTRNPITSEWVGDKAFNKGPQLRGAGGKLTNLIRQTYRLLLTRGLACCCAMCEGGDTHQRVHRMVNDEPDQASSCAGVPSITTAAIGLPLGARSYSAHLGKRARRKRHGTIAALWRCEAGGRT